MPLLTALVVSEPNPEILSQLLKVALPDIEASFPATNATSLSFLHPIPKPPHVLF